MTARYETSFSHITYKPYVPFPGEAREVAVARVCDREGQYGWMPFSIDYEKEIIFFTRRIDPDREKVENYG